MDLYRGHARLVAPKRLQVDGQEIESDRIFINTGTRPEIPSIEGIAASTYLTNASVMELSDIPEHLIVLGGGYIGLEFGQMHLLVATGRRANTDDLGLELAGIATDAKGFVTVNGRLETNVTGVYALGDVKGGPALTHISYNDYQILYANLWKTRR